MSTPVPPTPPPVLPAPPAAPAPAGRQPKAAMWTMATMAVVCLAGLLWLVIAKLPGWMSSPTTGQPEAPASASADTRKIRATLFYVSADGSELVPASREVEYGATPGEQARRIAEAQLQPAPAGRLSAIPTGTTVRGFYMGSKGEAYLDVSRDIITGHTGGSLDEALTVYAIVNALTVNLADVTSVQILVEGKAVDTLAGHVDLRRPLVRSLKWVRKGS